jgi:hypothetical protein
MKRLCYNFLLFFIVNLLSFFMYLPMHSWAEFVFRQAFISIIMTIVFASVYDPVFDAFRKFKNRSKQKS